jgi:hypothetical protein
MSRTFSTKNGSVESLKFSCKWGFAPEGPPDAHDGVLGQAGGGGHGAGAPVGRLRGPRLQGPGHDGFDLRVGDGAGRPATGCIPQRLQAALHKALPPFTDGLDGYPLSGGHGRIAQAAGTIQDDAGSFSAPRWSVLGRRARSSSFAFSSAVKISSFLGRPVRIAQHHTKPSYFTNLSLRTLVGHLTR